MPPSILHPLPSIRNAMRPIVPCLWFDRNAEEAVEFYLAVFPASRVTAVTRYPESDHPAHEGRRGEVLTIEFEINSQKFTALNGGPFFRFNEAVSFQVTCETQEEIDRYWDLLCEGGDPEARQCGWLKDKFGVSWQIVPASLLELITGDDERSARVMRALLPMTKPDIATLEQAAGLTAVDNTRVIHASREAVFEAIRDPERLARWWGPAGFRSTFHEFDFRPGGAWKLDMHGPDGSVYPNESRFREIVPDARVVIEHLGGTHHFILSIGLTDEAGGTRIHWHQEFDTPEERARVLAYVPRCNEENLDRLESELGLSRPHKQPTP